MTLKRLFSEFSKGIIKENPVLVFMIGLCSTLAISTEVENAIGMGTATTMVLLGSNILVSLLRNTIPPKVRIPVFIIAVASFTTIIDLVMYAYFPAMRNSLGIFIPLIVGNCILVARAEIFAVKNNVWLSAADALGTGFGYTLVLFMIAAVREALSQGTFWGINLVPKTNFVPILIMMLPPGAFITIGFMIAIMRGVRK